MDRLHRPPAAPRPARRNADRRVRARVRPRARGHRRSARPREPHRRARRLQRRPRAAVRDRPQRAGGVGAHDDDGRCRESYSARLRASIRDLADLRSAVPRGDRSSLGSTTSGRRIRRTSLALRSACATFGGLDVAIAGDVPQGAGLSSSAALEVASPARSAMHSTCRSTTSRSPSSASAPRTSSSACSAASWISSRRRSPCATTRCSSTAARWRTRPCRCGSRTPA